MAVEGMRCVVVREVGGFNKGRLTPISSKHFEIVSVYPVLQRQAHLSLQYLVDCKTKH